VGIGALLVGLVLHKSYVDQKGRVV
jgi:hypothetical protein